MWVLVLPSSVSSDENLLDLALRSIEEWHPSLTEMVGQTATDTIAEVTFRETVSLGRRSDSPRVTLLGDALHAMLPAGGEGGNNALQDAAELAQLLGLVKGGETTIEEAVRGYETKAILRGMAAIERSRVLGDSLFGFSARS